ncbi:MAG: HAMP domain-containing protein [Flavobacteriales bacterium]|nr:HAMP domain-containing protein [Flavobacteriales bacterium]MCB9447218.1 HAMP domain-containing protein [Flavobacteriales bacterium]
MRKISNSLFWRLSLFFLVSLMALAAAYSSITYRASMEYAKETSQRLNHDLAESIASHSQPFVQGELNEAEIEKLFQSVMVVNPSVEVYLLDNSGNILSFYAPLGKVQLKSIDLGPVHTFLTDAEAFIKGDDPRNPGEKKVFSAAPIMDNNQQVGYIYVILAGEEYSTVADMLQNSFRMKLATRSFILTLISTFVIGIIIIWFLTRNLNRIISSVNDFKNGNLKARIRMNDRGELSELARNINSMADAITENINNLKSVENLRKELIANVSHDLRTPLTAIQGYAETLVMMEDSPDMASRQKYAQIILSSTEKVKKLVDDLFEISKLESDHVDIKKEKFALSEVLSDILMKFELGAGKKSVELSLDVPKEPLYVEADLAMIDRAIQNLLDNALKHTPSGGKIRIAVRKQNNRQVDVMVEDTGVGIPQDDLPFIFDRYKKARDNTRAGSGLGLAIVKKILELHHADIAVESRQGQGTVFSFSLPEAG